MKIPKVVKVGGWEYKVRMNSEAARECKESGFVGATAWDPRRIDIDVTRDPPTISETFIHEVIHVADGVFQHTKLSEDEVTAISQGLFQVFEQCGVRFVK